MNILLHTCCAPCMIFPVDELSRDGHKVAGFFYNPNIHPYSEYLKRRSEVEKYSGETDFKMLYGDYDIERYFQYMIYDEGAKSRCPKCWWLRLEKTAIFARDNGFDAFTTTLLASPYQDQDMINSIGSDIAKNTGVGFYFKDFRPGFKEAHAIARGKGIYCQNYCGCIFSERERIEAKSAR